MKKSIVTSLGVIALAGALIGCGSDQPEFSKAQDDAIRHPQKDPNWKPPSQSDFQKEQQAIADFRKKQASQQVQFVNGH